MQLPLVAYPFFGPSQYFFGNATNVGTNTGYDYEWQITVEGEPAPSAVPIPAAAWLFGTGLIGLIGIARRKTAA